MGMDMKIWVYGYGQGNLAMKDSQSLKVSLLLDIQCEINI